jgi:proteasome lid subunit RPN8/RPN11
MPLHLTPSQFHHLTAHATRTYPQECCGLLLGRAVPNQTAQVIEIWSTPNAWTPEIGAELATVIPSLGTGKTDSQRDGKTERFYIDPQDLLNAQRYAREQQMNIIGIYHSHPDHPAEPSESDRRLAWSEYFYLILSVHQGIVQDHRCWKLDNNHQFQPEEVLLTLCST